MSEKRCSGCKNLKIFDEFHKNKLNKDGLQNYCKNCARNSIDIYQKKEIVLEKKHLREKGYRQNTKVKIRKNELDRKRYLNPEEAFKKKIRILTRQAVNKGTLKENPCEICNSKIDIEAHHARYDLEHIYDVIWLCKKHHEEEHVRLRKVKKETAYVIQ